ncbi:MAG: hypothetical protein ACJ8BW_29355 [Ktedonobacteraceae bacterium]
MCEASSREDSQGICTSCFPGGDRPGQALVERGDVPLHTCNGDRDSRSAAEAEVTPKSEEEIRPLSDANARMTPYNYDMSFRRGILQKHRLLRYPGTVSRRKNGTKGAEEYSDL